MGDVGSGSVGENLRHAGHLDPKGTHFTSCSEEE